MTEVLIQDMSAMMYNPNNVATEASPLTTELERQVGMDLAHMLGYRGQDPTPWGHITCVSIPRRSWILFRANH